MQVSTSYQSLRVNTPANYDHYFYGHGKLLLTGEYFVMDGACALGLPTKLGQSLAVKIKQSADPKLYWKSFDVDGHIWFEACFDLWHFECLSYLENEQYSNRAKFITKVLGVARKLNIHFLRDEFDFFVETKLDFPLSWGLGSSSTLLYNIAQWAYISPFELQSKVLGGSGYDVACAQAKGPIVYQKKAKGLEWKDYYFNPSYKDHLYFVYLGKKQNTEEGRVLYRQKGPVSSSDIMKISELTNDFLMVTNLKELEDLIVEHEEIVSSRLGITPVKMLYFSDYWGQVKSLGAWGGDFALATSEKSLEETKNYFLGKGLNVCIPYSELILMENFQHPKIHQKQTIDLVLGEEASTIRSSQEEIQ